MCTISLMLMASSVSHPRTINSLSCYHKPSRPINTPSLVPINQLVFKSNPFPFPFPKLDINNSNHHLGHSLPALNASRASSDAFIFPIEEEDEGLFILEKPPVKFLCWVLIWASLSVAVFAVSGDAKAAAAVDSIKASSFGLRVATALRTSGWPDEAVVFALATLPIIELRGAIPVGYWLQLNPTILTVLSVLGLVLISPSH